MKQPSRVVHEAFPDTHHDPYSRTTLGFWIYLMTDFVFFGALFATYAVLQSSTFGGPSIKEIFHVHTTLTPTLIMLLCSFTAGMGGVYAHRKDKKKTLLLFGITFLLGALFLWIEMEHFRQLLSAGHSWKKSAFLSAYFTIIGTYVIHMVLALLWTIVLLIPLWQEGTISHFSVRRLTCLKMFWQFLNIVWMFIFSFVYLMGG